MGVEKSANPEFMQSTIGLVWRSIGVLVDSAFAANVG